MIEYDTGDWKRKLSSWDAMGLHSDGYEGWDLDGDIPYSVKVEATWDNNVDFQHNIFCWADDNCEGYFYMYTFSTEHNGPTVTDGEKFSLTLRFQKKEDAVAFKLRWL